MLRKEITYTDINDVTRTEPFYFNFTELELGEIELEMGGIEETMKRLTETQDIKAAYKIFKELLLAGYGKKSADGKGFDKVDPDTGRPYSREFQASPAMSVFIIDLMNDVDDAALVFRKMLPTRMQKDAEEADKALAANPQMAPGATPESVQAETTNVTQGVFGGTVQQVPTAEPVLEKEKTINEYSREELLTMDQKLFDHLAGKDPREMDKNVLVIAMQRKNTQ